MTHYTKDLASYKNILPDTVVYPEEGLKKG